MELPRLKPLYEKYGAQGLKIVFIDRSNDTENARQFIDEHQLPFTFLENGEDQAEVVRGLFGVTAFPTSFLIDSRGKIVFAHVGFNPGDEELFAQKVDDSLHTD